jgi:hypothetical protein
MADRSHSGVAEHVEDSRTCWCDPELLQPCPECGGDPADANCWKCGGRGCVPMFDEDEPVIIVHRYSEDTNG